MKREWLAALFILLTLGRSALKEVERTAAQEVRQRLGGGEVHVQIRPDGARGLTEGRLKRVVVQASHFAIQELPFSVEPLYARSGLIEEFVLDLRDAQLSGLRAERIYASIPNVRYDRHIAMSKRVFRLSETGVGRSEIVITEESLADYIEFKYRPYVKEVTVRITPEKTVVTGRALILVGEAAFRAEGQLVPRDGIYLDLADADIQLDGETVVPETARALEQWLNPVIDAVKDLRVADALRVETLRLEPGRMIAIGTARVPSNDFYR